VWMGNDDFTPTKHMVGGSLPAMTWHDIMAYANQGVELRQLPGLPAPQHVQVAVEGAFKGDEPHPALLTRKAIDALVHVEQMLDDADRALAAQYPVPALSGVLAGADDDGGSGGNGGNGGHTRADAVAAIANQKSAPVARGD
jgi:membrane peptidoglycan carboxypeptidase